MQFALRSPGGVLPLSLSSSAHRGYRYPEEWILALLLPVLRRRRKAPGLYGRAPSSSYPRNLVFLTSYWRILCVGICSRP